ncbi:MAG: hypothetical protein H0V75_10920 [Rubrobacter sp.]|nr:hypothetical protein [Rubrobacter sp.]
MRCAECGAELPGEESCADRFHAFLAAEHRYYEAFSMHGLFVLAYHVQHPSLCKPWMRARQRETLREIFVEEKRWREVLSWPKDRRLRQAAVDQLKEQPVGATDTPEVGHPIEGEMTVVDLGSTDSPDFPSEYPQRVESWAASLAEHRLL